MSETIQNTIDSFSDFLNENKNFIGKQEYFNYLLSFKFPEFNHHLDHKLSSIIKNFPRVFYFDNPENHFSITSFGSALEISENGLGRLSSLNKTLGEIKNQFICNWNGQDNNFPLICGGMKFTTEHSEDEWIDFKDSDWFVPEFMHVKVSGKNHLFYNFLNNNSSIDRKIEKFSQKLGSLLSIKDRNDHKQLNILSSKGTTPKDKKKWKTLVSDTLSKLSENNLAKIVLSRRIDLALSSEPCWDDVRNYFADQYPNCSIFFYHNNSSTFFGASPERLIKFHNRKVTIDVLAGSIPRGKNTDEDKELERKMISSSKLNHEHDLVIHQIKKAISGNVSKIFVEKIPFKKLHNIQHLHTILKSELLPNTNIAEIIEAIYPTGAICGEPKDKALSLLKKIEDYKRGLYSGIIGYFNLNDDGEFVIGIRSALLHENKLFAYAGCGIVEGSDPEKEYEETELKFNAILSFFDEKNKSK